MAFFARIADDEKFRVDRDRVKTLIELYYDNDCLWNVHSGDYKNLMKKKKAKTDIGTHFGLSGSS